MERFDNDSQILPWVKEIGDSSELSQKWLGRAS